MTLQGVAPLSPGLTQPQTTLSAADNRKYKRLCGNFQDLAAKFFPCNHTHHLEGFQMMKRNQPVHPRPALWQKCTCHFLLGLTEWTRLNPLERSHYHALLSQDSVPSVFTRYILLLGTSHCLLTHNFCNRRSPLPETMFSLPANRLSCGQLNPRHI